MNFNSFSRLLLCMFLLVASIGNAQQQIENLSRGLIAVPASNGVLISWRLLHTDEPAAAFNVYREIDGVKLLLNKKPITNATCFLDSARPVAKCRYIVQLLSAKEQEPENGAVCDMPANPNPFLSVPLHFIEGYTPNDVSVGDMDGDGNYELVVHQTGIAK